MRRPYGLLACLCALFVVHAAAADASERRVPASKAEVQLSYAPLVKRAAPAVVNIYATREVEQVVRSPLFNDPFFRRFFGDRFGLEPEFRRKRMQNSLGSGVIVSREGLIVTNHHVVAQAGEITVALADRREFEAELVLDDERTDLAVLRIANPDGALPFLELRDSDELEVGDLVLAIGNPFNVGQTVTSGIVSALARTDVAASDFQFFIQTDAAINPGNSGGALIGMDGRLVGINTAIYSRSGGSLGIGFAVPTNMVRAVLLSAQSGSSFVRRPWFGAATQTVSAEIAASLGLKRPQGVMVRDVHAEGPAARAGIAVGDLILAVDGQEVDSPQALTFRLGTRVIGGTARVDVLRQGGSMSVDVALVAAPETPVRDARELSGRHPLAGATVANLSPALAEELGIDTMARGVIITEIAGRSPANRLRFKTGDRILNVNSTPVASVRELASALRQPGERWEITVKRGDKTTKLRISI